jgi:hypothetical protein
VVLSDLGMSDKEDAVTLLVARRIIELASEGELDLDGLRTATLAAVRGQRSRRTRSSRSEEPRGDRSPCSNKKGARARRVGA